MPDIFFHSTQGPQAIWRRKLRRASRRFQMWSRSLVYSLIEIMILCAATTVIFITVLSFIKALWHLYLHTPSGHKFTSDASLLINTNLAQLLSKDLIFFSIEVTAITLITCLTLSAICQVLTVRRIFYEGRGLANRITWVLLFVTVSAHILTDRSQVDFPVALGLSLVPAMCMFATCLTVAARLLPEVTFGGIVQLTRRLINFVANPES